MDQLLKYAFDGHTLHTKLLRLDAPFAMTPHVPPIPAGTVSSSFEAQTR
jgi:hypothetical protein